MCLQGQLGLPSFSCMFHVHTFDILYNNYAWYCMLYQLYCITSKTTWVLLVFLFGLVLASWSDRGWGMGIKYIFDLSAAVERLYDIRRALLILLPIIIRFCLDDFWWRSKIDVLSITFGLMAFTVLKVLYNCTCGG